MGVRERLRICEPNHQPYGVVRTISSTRVMHELQALPLLYLQRHHIAAYSSATMYRCTVVFQPALEMVCSTARLMASHRGLPLGRSVGGCWGGRGRCRRQLPFMLPVRRRALRDGRHRPRHPRGGSAEHSPRGRLPAPCRRVARRAGERNCRRSEGRTRRRRRHRRPDQQ